MFIGQEQMKKSAEANIAVLEAASQSQVAAMQELATLNLQVLKSMFETSLANSGAMLAAKGVQEALNAQASMVQPGIQAALDYWQKVYSLTARGQAEMSKLAERRVAESVAELTSMLDSMASNLPPTSRAALGAAKSIVQASGAAFANVRTAAEQALVMGQAQAQAITESSNGSTRSRKAA